MREEQKAGKYTQAIANHDPEVNFLALVIETTGGMGTQFQKFLKSVCLEIMDESDDIPLPQYFVSYFMRPPETVVARSNSSTNVNCSLFMKMGDESEGSRGVNMPTGFSGGLGYLFMAQAPTRKFSPEREGEEGVNVGLLEEKVRVLNEQLQDTKTRLVDSEFSLQEALEWKRDLEKLCRSHDEEIVRMKDELSRKIGVQKRCEELESQLVATREKIGPLESELVQVKRTVTDLERQLGSKASDEAKRLEEDMTILEARLVEANAEKELQLLNISELEAQLEETKNKVSVLETQLQEQTVNGSDVIAEDAQTIVLLEEKVAMLETKLKLEQEVVTSLKQELEDQTQQDMDAIGEEAQVIMELEQNVERLEKLVKDGEAEVAKKQAKIDSLQTNLDEVSHSSKVLTDSLLQLEKEVKEKNDALSKMEQLKVSAQALENQFESQARELDVAKEEHQMALDKLEAELKSQLDSLQAKHKQEVEQLEQEWKTDKDSELASLKESLNEIQDKYENALETIKTQSSDAEKRIAQIKEEQSREMSIQIETTESSLRNFYEASLSKNKETIALLEGQHETALETIKTRDADLNAAEERIAKVQEEYRGKLFRLEEQMREMSLQIDTVQSRAKDDMKQMQTMAEQEHRRLRGELKLSQNEVKKMEQDVRHAREVLEEFKIEAWKNESNYKNELLTLQEMKSTNEKEMRSMQQRLISLQSDRKIVQLALEKAQVKVGKMENKLLEGEKAIAWKKEKERELKQLEQAKAELKRENGALVDSLRQELAQLRSKMNSAESSVRTERMQKLQNEESINKLREQLKEVTKEKIQLKQMLDVKAKDDESPAPPNAESVTPLNMYLLVAILVALIANLLVHFLL